MTGFWLTFLACLLAFFTGVGLWAAAFFGVSAAYARTAARRGGKTARME